MKENGLSEVIKIDFDDLRKILKEGPDFITSYSLAVFCNHYCKDKDIDCKVSDIVRILEELDIVSFSFGLHDNYFIVN